jgi:hypothetical protein
VMRVLAILVAFTNIAHADPQKVTVGVYVNQITGIDIKNSKFDVDFYIWFRWEGELKPMDTFEVANGRITSKSACTKHVYGAQNHTTCRIVATVTKFFEMHRFPLDDHSLDIQIEDSESDTRNAVYVADDANATINPDLHIPGWVVEGYRGALTTQVYRTNYGDITQPHDRESAYSRYVFTVDVSRPGYGRFMRVFFGLFISVLISWCAFHVRPKESSPRVSLGVGATFAAAAVTVAINNSLPDTNAITMADKLIMLTLGCIVASVAETIAALTLAARGKEELQRRLDKVCAFVFPAFYLAMLVVIVV